MSMLSLRLLYVQQARSSSGHGLSCISGARYDTYLVKTYTPSWWMEASHVETMTAGHLREGCLVSMLQLLLVQFAARFLMVSEHGMSCSTADQGR